MKPFNFNRLIPALLPAFLACAASTAVAAWQPAAGPLTTRWTKDVKPTKVLPEYPRPQMVREQWQNLNGLWSYAIVAKDAPQPVTWDGEILVPFAVESALSGVMKPLQPEQRLWYRRTFEVPKKWQGQRVLLHFGAVDWEATVWLNGKELGTHRGGFDAFSFDLTDALKPGAAQEIVVAVWDPTDRGPQAKGKQVLRPGGIMYTATSGIWQTAWLEPVHEVSIQSLRLTPDLDTDGGLLRVALKLPGGLAERPPKASGKLVIRAEVHEHGNVLPDSPLEIQSPRRPFIDGPVTLSYRVNSKVEVQFSNYPQHGVGTNSFIIPVEAPKLWSPDSPHLYGLRLTILLNGKKVDEVDSYFAMRKISLGPDADGTLRLCLNNKPLFQFGPLDQGFWPDGLFTAPTDEALRYDIEMTKKLGFNMARKHVKVEPDRWYYWCDKLGLLVWQDMPGSGVGDHRTDAIRPGREEAAKQFETEMQAMIQTHWNHPCIVMWVPFNEGWGQYDTPRIVQMVKQLDPSRLVNNASGWTDRKVGDVNDMHRYPGPGVPAIETNRAVVLGEFGGLGLPVRGHSWQAEKNWGYRSFTNSATLTTAYLGLIDKLHPMTGKPGLSAAVYTQTTDVEVEVNGLMTYDRALVKPDEQRISAANRRVYLPAPPVPVMKTLVPTAQTQSSEWRYTTKAPGDNWFAPAFDVSAWSTGPAGFGTRGTPGSTVRTEWRTSDIWLRRSFELPADFKPKDLSLLLHHDEDAEIYINGQLVAQVEGYASEYITVPLDEKGAGALRPGTNLLAIHCHQTTGGQFIDAGIVQAEPAR